MGQVGEQTRDIHLAELLEELGGQIGQIDEPLGNILIHVESCVGRIGQVLDDHEGHLVKCKVLALTDGLDLRLDLIFVGFRIRDHEVKDQN